MPRLKWPAGSAHAVRVLLAMGVCWAVISALGLNDPVWALISVIMVTDPDPSISAGLARARLLNTMAGVTLGLTCLLLCGTAPWVVFLGVALMIVIGTQRVQSPAKLRLATLTVVLVLGAGAVRHSTGAALETGLKRAGEVLLGCVVPPLVAWVLDWVPRAASEVLRLQLEADQE
jgi:uncharacterized membrane protein YccC